MTNSVLKRSTDGDVAVLDLDDGKANALSFDVLAALDGALDEAFESSKSVALIGREGKFCAGFDLKIMTGDPAEASRLLATGGDLARKILTAPIPVVFGVTGHALAMGGILLTTADYRVGAAGSFKIGLNEVAIGMPVPGFAVELCRNRLSPRWFTRSVQHAHAFSPTEAVDANFFDEICAVEDCRARAIAVATQLAAHVHPKPFQITRDNVMRDLLVRLDAADKIDRETFKVNP